MTLGAVVKDADRYIVQIAAVLHVVIVHQQAGAHAFHNAIIAETLARFEHAILQLLSLLSGCNAFWLRLFVIHEAL
jgi:hypothetical protein